jgi:hypothetical protein
LCIFSDGVIGRLSNNLHEEGIRSAEDGAGAEEGIKAEGWERAGSRQGLGSKGGKQRRGA